MTSKRIGRRAFVARTSLGILAAGAGGGALGQMGGGGMGGGGMGGGGMGGGGMGGGGVIDPPLGPPFADPPTLTNVSTTPGVVDVSVDARVAPAVVNGVPANLLTYNGSFIAPTIRVRKVLDQAGEDRALVNLHFRNALPSTGETNILGHPENVSNIHVHGWHVSPGYNPDGLPSDNVMIPVAPGGGMLDYEYDLSKQRPGTLALYHPHVHGVVAEQFWGGLVGALDVEDHPITTLAGIETHVVVLKDITIVNGAPAPYTSTMEYMHGKEGEVVTVNGQVNPYLTFRPGEVKRLRFLNASTARFYRLSLQGHAMHVIGTDGGLLDKPYPVSEMLLSSGERLDVLVQATSSGGSYKLLALPYARMGMMASPQVTLMTVKVSGSKARGASIPSTVNRDAVRLSSRVDGLPSATFSLSMSMSRGYVNGISFEILPDGSIRSYEHMSYVNTEEVWTIVNQTNMDHPWHQHVNDGQVIGWTGGDAAYANYAQFLASAPAWKDVIIVPKNGSVTFRLPIRDYAGMSMFHCHILEHEDIGMMGMWHIMERM